MEKTIHKKIVFFNYSIDLKFITVQKKYGIHTK